MKKPRAPSQAQRRKQFEGRVADLAVGLAGLAEAAKSAGISVSEIAVTFAHLQKTLTAAHSTCVVVAQTNDAAKFSLDHVAEVESVPSPGLVPINAYEGRYVGVGTTPKSPAPPATSSDDDGEGMMMV